MADPITTTLKIGRRTSASGNPEYGRGDYTAAQAMFQSHGKYHDAVLRGKCFSAMTAAAGVAPGTLLSTDTSAIAFSLYNPTGSGFNLHVLRASVGFRSGTLGAGSIVYAANVNPAAAATTGTAITPVNNLLGGGSGVGRPLTTATVPAASTPCRPFASLTALVASTATPAFQLVEDVDSEFIITPGCSLSLHAIFAAAGTSPLLYFGMTWEEFVIEV